MKKHLSRLLWGALTLLTVAFIWGNSLQTGEDSGNLSQEILAWLHRTLPFLRWVTEFMLRKAAHFTEYALLGLNLTGFRRTFPGKGMSGVLLAGMAAALTDETIQLFTAGRGSSVIDVWIDSSGACAGMLALLLLCALLKKR